MVQFRRSIKTIKIEKKIVRKRALCLRKYCNSEIRIYNANSCVYKTLWKTMNDLDFVVFTVNKRSFKFSEPKSTSYLHRPMWFIVDFLNSNFTPFIWFLSNTLGQRFYISFAKTHWISNLEHKFHWNWNWPVFIMYSIVESAV